MPTASMSSCPVMLPLVDLHHHRGGPRLAEGSPRLHEFPPLLELVAAPVGGLRFVADAVGKCMLASLMRK